MPVGGGGTAKVQQSARTTAKAPASASHRKAGAQPRVPRCPAGGRSPPEGARREALEVVLQKDLRATAATSLEAFEGGTRRRLAPRALSRPAASSAVGRDPLKLRGSLPDNLPPGRRGRPDLTAPARPPPGPSRAARGRGHLEAAGDVDAGQRGVPALHQPQLHHEINID